ncbi:MAG TPA: COX15/CtaA family protein [Catalimonadaceae bacterium]|nr:COX15/CtaA family protein [Catalimonadaceae bacterium]
MPDSDNAIRRYRRSIRTSFFLVLFLVFVGGVVRSTGAGLGCPDWPKCFGLWVPPTHISEVPDKYWNDPLSSVNGQIIFNPVKTWTEYINRLIGVVIGISIFLQFVFAVLYGPTSAAKRYSLLALILVLFEGWLGAKVVSTDLKPLVISIHLVVALILGCALLAALFYASDRRKPVSPFSNRKPVEWVMWVTSGLIFLQFFLGTEVRSQVDVLFRKYDFDLRDLYVSQLNWSFYVHRTLSILVLVMMVLQIIRFSKRLPVVDLYQVVTPLVLTFFLIFSGVILVYFGFPALVQPFHLLLGFSIVCSQFWLILNHRFSEPSSHGSA